MKLVFLPEAHTDIERLFEFLLDENPDAAAKAMVAIDEGATKLEEFPELGISMKDDNDRQELFIPFGKSIYVLRYRINLQKKEIVILRVWHGRKNVRNGKPRIQCLCTLAVPRG